MNFKFLLATDKRTRIGLLLMAAFLLANTWFSIEYTLRIIHNDDLENEAHDTISRIFGVDSFADDLESGERGFLLSGQTQYLEIMKKASSSLSEELILLKKLVANDPFQNEKLNLLLPVIQEKIDFSNTVVDIRKTNGMAAAALIISQGKGKEIMDRISDLLTQMIATEEAAVKQCQTDSSWYQRQTILFFVLTLCVALVFFGIRFLLAGKGSGKPVETSGNRIKAINHRGERAPYSFQYRSPGHD